VCVREPQSCRHRGLCRKKGLRRLAKGLKAKGNKMKSFKYFHYYGREGHGQARLSLCISCGQDFGFNSNLPSSMCTPSCSSQRPRSIVVQSPLKSPADFDPAPCLLPHGTISQDAKGRERQTLLFLAKLNGRPYFLLVQTFTGGGEPKTFPALRAASHDYIVVHLHRYSFDIDKCR